MFVALLAIFNGERPRSWPASSPTSIGRVVTIGLVCVMQAVGDDVLRGASRPSATFILGSAVVGRSYGACLSLFPATTADNWGTKNLGLNYGILFTAWGVGGVIGPTLAGKIADKTGSYAGAYGVAGGAAPRRGGPRHVQLRERLGQHPGEGGPDPNGRRSTESEEVPAVFPPQARAVAGADSRSM